LFSHFPAENIEHDEYILFPKIPINTDLAPSARQSPLGALISYLRMCPVRSVNSERGRGRSARVSGVGCRSGGITQLQGPPARAGPGQAVGKTRVGSKSALKLFVAVTLGCQGTNKRVFASEPPQTPHTPHTHCNALQRSLHLVELPMSSLAAFGKSPAARGSRDGPRTPPKPKTEVGGRNGTWTQLGRS
jgi:hypothetical protein